MTLAEAIRQCRQCEAHLPAGARPVVSFSPTARLVIVSQAPGAKVHESGIAWNDASGDRLRDWTGLTKAQMHDASRVALVPMGFCYPGKAKGGDKPPRRECAATWHERVWAELPDDRLTLLVGTYAQRHYLPHTRAWSLTERVRRFREFLPGFLPLPHPAWRSRLWMDRHPWFESDVLPELRDRVAQRMR